jgi:hypothetical protein
MKQILGILALIATALFAHYVIDPWFAVTGIVFCGALEVLTGFATAAGAVNTALGGGDFLAGGNVQVKNYTNGQNAFILNCWGHFQGLLGISMITSPRIHPGGIRHRPTAAVVYPLMSAKDPQKVYAQDVLNVLVQGSAVAGDIESFSMLLYYQSIPGSDQFLINPSQLLKLGVNVTTIEVPLVAGVAGGYSGAAAGNSGTQQLKPNVRYALVGGHSSLMQCTIGVRGPDFGGLRIGFPGNSTDKDVNGNFFVRLSNDYEFGLIPVFNSASLANMLVDTVNNENAASPVATLNVVELAG